MTEVVEWLQSHDDVLWALGIFGILCFVGSLLLLPILVARIPEDYFAHRHRESSVGGRHPVARVALALLKNAVGLLLVLAGIAMLVLPGQGILTIVIGLLVMDFPGKYHLEQALVRRRTVLSGLNWIRRRAGRRPLIVTRTSP